MDSWGGRAGISALVGSSVHAHAGVSRRGRFPALRESFSGSLDRFAPNPDLGSERLTAVEAGVTAHLLDAQLQLVGFRHRPDDAIVRLALADGRFMRVNENRLASHGLELMLDYALGRASVGGDMTVQSARLVSPLRRTGRLENQPEAFGSHGRAPLPFNARASVHANYTGNQFCLASTGDDVALPAATRLAGAVTRQWTVRAADRGALLSEPRHASPWTTSPTPPPGISAGCRRVAVS